MLRSQTERWIQSILYEISGLILFVPIFNYITNSNMTESVTLLIFLTIVFVLWTVAYNYVFDELEWRYFRIAASDRSPFMRGFHAVMLEASSAIVCVPILVYLAGLTWIDAFLADAALTLLSVIYAFIFYQTYDFLRPVDNQSVAIRPSDLPALPNH